MTSQRQKITNRFRKVAWGRLYWKRNNSRMRRFDGDDSGAYGSKTSPTATRQGQRRRGKVETVNAHLVDTPVGKVLAAILEDGTVEAFALSTVANRLKWVLDNGNIAAEVDTVPLEVLWEYLKVLDAPRQHPPQEPQGGGEGVW